MTSIIAPNFLWDSAFADQKSEKNNKITICHIPPGNPDNAHTISISESALDTHLNHGDNIGKCSSTNEEPPTNEDPPKKIQDFDYVRKISKAKVTLCHNPLGYPSNAKTLTINSANLYFHLNHGDILGKCKNNFEPVESKENFSQFTFNYERKGSYAICHTSPGNPNDPYTRGMVSDAAVAPHLYTGDRLGACELDDLGDIVTICHNTGLFETALEASWSKLNSGGYHAPPSYTIKIEKSDLDTHLTHGDHEGVCGLYRDGDLKVKSVQPNDETLIDLDEYDLVQKFPICHFYSEDRTYGITMITDDLVYHLNHGDYMGKCPNLK